MLAASVAIPTDRIRKLPLSAKEMGDEVRRIREQVFDWSQQDLADMLGGTARTIGRWENGAGGIALVAAYELLKCWEQHERGQRQQPAKRR